MTNSPKNKAVILGMSPTGLGIARALGRNGIDVIALDYNPKMPGLKSKYCLPMLCPHPVREPQKLVDLLVKETGNSELKPVLYPTSDEFVLFVSSFRDQLEKKFLFSVPANETVENLLNKRSFFLMAERFNIPHPRTFYPSDRSDVGWISRDITYPAFIKPCLTYEWKSKGFDTKGFIVNNGDELSGHLTQLLDCNIEVVIQSFVKGPPTNLYEVCCYCSSGKDEITAFVKRKLRQFPYDCGLGSYMESTMANDLIETAKIFLNHIHFIGPVEIEYKKDDFDNQFKIIEVNVRLTLQNSLADACGINFPLIQYYDLIGHEYQIPEGYDEGIKWLWAEIDFQSFLELNKKHKLKLFDWLRSVYKADQYAIYSHDDIWPFLKSTHYGLNLLKLPFSIFKNFK